MDYQKLGNTDLNVSRLCLGTMTMGWTSDKQESFTIMDYAYENGINFFDTADVYSFWVEGNDGGVAESWIGDWLKERHLQGKVIIATKVRGPMWAGPDGVGLGRAHLMQAVEDSLCRLKIETIDLYQSHWPDEDIAVEETLRAYEEMIKQGKVRYIGCSNYNVAQLQEALDVAAVNNLPRYDTLQPHYNLVHRHEYEAELMALCERENIGVVPYSPLAGGFLTGKYKRDEGAPQHSRGYGNDRMRPYMNDEGFTIVEVLTEIGRAHRATSAQMAIVWMLANPTVASAIIGASNFNQLVETMKVTSLTISPEEKARLDALPSPT
jgi:aryl-alcohol dehydrogenase-like predicted oxidoreductase